jgi:hypothetical protein
MRAAIRDFHDLGKHAKLIRDPSAHRDDKQANAEI